MLWRPVLEVSKRWARETVLFLCTYNAARSQIGEGFINAPYSDRYEARSTGSEPTKVHPCAIIAMAEVGIDISSHRSKHLDEFERMHLDYVATLCADAEGSCPIFSSGETYLQHAVPNPASDTGHVQEGRTSFRKVRDQIRAWTDAVFGGVNAETYAFTLLRLCLLVEPGCRFIYSSSRRSLQHITSCSLRS